MAQIVGDSPNDDAAGKSGLFGLNSVGGGNGVLAENEGSLSLS